MSFKKKRFEEAIQHIRPSKLSGVDSPYWSIALELAKRDDLENARAALDYIPEDHWQYKRAREFKDKLWQSEVDNLRSTILNLQLTMVNAASDSLAQTTFPPAPAAITRFSEVLEQLKQPQKSSLSASDHTLTYQFPQQLERTGSKNPRQERTMDLETADGPEATTIPTKPQSTH